jgi:hypothetical protein
MELPSPHSVTHHEFGRASLAPRMPHTPMPIAASRPLSDGCRLSAASSIVADP